MAGRAVPTTSWALTWQMSDQLRSNELMRWHGSNDTYANGVNGIHEKRMKRDKSKLGEAKEVAR
eukprot:scaffold69275_cov15-Prasinocladus_malaysianus.AAC.1